MNSFNTDEDIEKVLPKYRQVQVKVFMFNQSRYPRIDRESMMPLATDLNNTQLEEYAIINKHVFALCL